MNNALDRIIRLITLFIISSMIKFKKFYLRF